MTSSTPIFSASAARPVSLRVRPDLQFSAQSFQGRECWAVKDPLRLKYFRFEQEELELLRMFDGQASLDGIRAAFEARFAPQRISTREIQQFANRAFQSRLLIADAAGQASTLLERRAEQRRRAFWQALANPLAIRIPLFNPDRLLSQLDQAVGWLLSPVATAFSCFLMLAAVVLMLVEFDELQSRLPSFEQFFGPENWIWLALVLAGTKVLHEIGHGLACKRFGGECHESGLMLLVMTPCLYCNVSDAWMLRDKWRRMAIGAAGMYVELLLAALCVIGWWFTHPGLFHFLCLNVVFVCSVSTIVFNANPLLRYDGYYILCDWLEIPNLRRQASTMLSRWWARLTLGIVQPTDPFLPTRRSWLFGCFAGAAFVYRWVVTLSVLWFLNRVFEPHGFQALGRLVMIAVVLGMIAQPIRSFIRFTRTPGTMMKIKWTRAAWSSAVAVGLLSAAVCVPLPYRVNCEVRIEPREAATLYVEVPGRIAAIHVKHGSRVEAGEPIVTLDNIELRQLVDELEAERRQLNGRLEGLRQRGFRDQSALGEIRNLQNAIAVLQEQLRERRENLRRLTITAPVSGLVVAPPEDDPAEARYWDGRVRIEPLENCNLGASLPAGLAVCRIAEPGRYEALLSIDQSEMPRIHAGLTADIFLRQSSGSRLRTRIEHVSSRRTERTRSPDSRGVDPSWTTASHSSSNVDTHRFAASCPIDDLDETIVFGATGQARIHAGRQTLATRVCRSVMQTIRFDL